MREKINYKAMDFGAFWGRSFKLAGECFWAMLGLTLACAVLALVIGLGGALLRVPTFATIVLCLIMLLYYPSAVKIVGSRAEGAPVGVFASMQSSGIPAFHFITAALLMSVPISAISLGLHFAGVDDWRLAALFNVINLFALLYVVFVLAAVALREKTFWEAFRYSFSVVKNNYWKTLGYLASIAVFAVAVYIIYYLVMYFAVFVSGASYAFMSGKIDLPLMILIGLGMALVNLVFITWLTSFIYSAYALLFLKLEDGVYGELDFDELDKTAPAQTVVPSAEPLENYDNLPESEKFYRSIFDKANKESAFAGGEMPTLYVDTANASEQDIEKILQKRLRDRDKNRQQEDGMEKTVTLSQQNLEITLEDTEYLPENPGVKTSKEPLPPPGPVTPRLKVVNVPPPPPDKNK
ncbi:MAG: glycerophosphoryl diester phosphodiesterase membrane domain-containing protein [Elusimicrobium sp.]|jgi:hypothetical protein|nr:glycerophosphoryl diester phosphodiesterase membrane domain-containing protein [Elusimicrobium sp.]